MSPAPNRSETSAIRRVPPSPREEYASIPQAPKPNASITEAVTNSRWKALRDMSEPPVGEVRHRDHHQHQKKNGGERQRGVNELFLGNQVHEIRGDERRLQRRDEEGHEDGGHGPEVERGY